MLSQARHAVRVTLQVALLAAIGTAFFLRIPQVTGPSMLPQVQPGELVVINTLAYRMGAPARGDVVALRRDEPTAQTFLKRVVGLPGERVRLRDGVLYVDGRRIDEPYVTLRDRATTPEITVPADALYVLGDNRGESEDSRTWGPIPDAAVIGKALGGIWPPRKLSP